MNDLNDLDRRIREQLTADEDRLRLRQNHTKRLMEEVQACVERYTETADRLMQTVVRPRGEKLKEHFPNAIAPEEKNNPHTIVYRFAHTPQVPATVTIELGITRNGHATTLVVQYRLTILPTFFPIKNNDQLSMSLDAVDEEKITRWVEDKIVAFVETYLRLETLEQYQTQNTATDLVCGMSVQKAHSAATLENGKRAV